MAKLVIAKQLAGKKVVASDGEEIGKLVDIYIEETTGKLEVLLCEPNPDSPTARNLKSDGGLVSVPYNAVLAISDFIIVDKRAVSKSTSSILEGYGNSE